MLPRYIRGGAATGVMMKMTNKARSYIERGRAFARSGNLPAALQMAEWATDHEAALAALHRPDAWYIAAEAGAAAAIGLIECDNCQGWTSAEAENCEHCGAAVMPF